MAGEGREAGLRFTVMPRPRLSRAVLRTPTPKLTILTGPAGYGKSTLLDEWRADLSDQGMKVAMVRIRHIAGSIDDQALQASGLIAKSLGIESGEAPWSAVLDVVSAELGRSGEPAWIMFDNDGAGGAEAALKLLLGHLVETSGENLRLIFAGRHIPDVPVSRLRVSNQLLILDGPQLSFDADEITRFFATWHDRPVSPFDGNRLTVLTEGWPAGIRFAAQLLQKTRWHKDALDAFAGLPPEVAAFFDECVAGSLTESELRALTRTAILAEIDMASCSALLGPLEAHRIMDRLDRGDLFAERSELINGGFRYHPLFRSYLQNRLSDVPDGEIATLHRRMSLYCETNASWAGAVHHAFACGDLARATNLAERCAAYEVSKGNLSTVLQWITRIPREELASRRLLLAASGTGYALSLRLEEARAIALALREVLRTTPHGPEMAALASQHRILEICIAYMSDDGRALLALAREPIAPGDKWLDMVLSNALIHGNLIAGHLATARAASVAPLENVADEQVLHSSVCQRCLIGLCDVAENRFDDAEVHFHAAYELASGVGGPSSVPAALAASLLAMVAFEKNDLERAADLLAGRLDLMEDTAFVEAQVACHLTLARLNDVNNRNGDANLVLDRGMDLARRRGWIRLQASCLLESIRLALRHGQTVKARSLAATLRSLPASMEARSRTPSDYAVQLSSIADGWLLLVSNRPAAAVRHFERLQHSGLWDETLASQARMAHAAALYGVGRRAIAIETVIELIEAAASTGGYRSLLDSIGQTSTVVSAAVGVLMESNDDRVAPAFLRKLLRDLRSTASHRDASSALLGFTARETELVKLMRYGMTNKQIANELGIGLETVKWHLKGVFRKLGARNRTEVVSRISQLHVEESPSSVSPPI